MAHKIFGDRFLARGEPAWHDSKGALTFPEDETLSVSDAISRSNMDYELQKVPTYIEIDGERYETGKYAVVRPPLDDEHEPHIYSREVSEQYGLLQNTALARILDPIAERWPVETVGALSNGERIFMMLRAEDTSVGPDDELKQYFLVTDHKTGGGKVQMLYTAVRVVCWNTLMAALRSAEVDVSIAHTQDIEDDVDMQAKIMHQMEVAQQKTLEAFEQMIATDIRMKDAKKVFEQAYPLPSKSSRAKAGEQISGDSDFADEADLSESQRDLALSALERYERRRDRQKRLQEAAIDRYIAFNDAHHDMARTSWAAYNACTELSDWRRGREGAGRATLLGNRAEEKKRAFTAALSLAN